MRELHEWLLSVAHVDDGGTSFVRDLAAQLRARGLPLWRVSLSLLTKHPEVLWRTVQWHEDDGVRILDRQHKSFQDPFFTLSPVALLLRGSASIRVCLTQGAPPFPI